MGKAGVSLKGLVLAGAAVAVLCGAGCNGKRYLAVNGEGDHTARPPGGATPGAPPPVQPSAAIAPARDQCGAGPLQYLIGKDRTEIPVAAQLNRRRVVCTTCPMTQDYRPDRQTILYDEATKKVTAVRCG